MLVDLFKYEFENYGIKTVPAFAGTVAKNSK